MNLPQPELPRPLPRRRIRLAIRADRPQTRTERRLDRSAQTDRRS